jgi:hypothetical protein
MSDAKLNSGKSLIVMLVPGPRAFRSTDSLARAWVTLFPTVCPAACCAALENSQNMLYGEYLGATARPLRPGSRSGPIADAFRSAPALIVRELKSLGVGSESTHVFTSRRRSLAPI